MRKKKNMKRPTFELIISCMNKEPKRQIEEQNIRCNCIVVNQCDQSNDLRMDNRGHDLLWINRAERGVGRSRNTGLMRATSDIVLFGDEDCVYTSDLESLVIDQFEEHPEADILLFDYNYIDGGARISKTINSYRRVGRFSYMKYGAVRIAARRESLYKSGIMFSLLFGPGARYSNGEDAIFLHDCIKCGMKIYTTPTILGNVIMSSSSWFTGYNAKYYSDRGALHARVAGKLHPLISMRLAIKQSGQQGFEIGIMQAILIMVKSGNEFICEKR